MREEFICFLYNKRLVEELGVPCDDIEAKITIDLKQIESVRQRVNDGETRVCEKTCMVHLKSGDSFMIGKSYNEMIKIWYGVY